MFTTYSRTHKLEIGYVLKREADLAAKLLRQKQFNAGVQDALSTIAKAYQYGIAVLLRLKNVLIDCVVDTVVNSHG